MFEFEHVGGAEMHKMMPNYIYSCVKILWLFKVFHLNVFRYLRLSAVYWNGEDANSVFKAAADNVQKPSS